MTGATRADPVSLTEALERLLPHHEDNPDEVACWLDDQQPGGHLPLLGGGVVMASSANPAMLGIVAHIPPVGRPFLYVQVRQDLGTGYHLWEPGHTVESLAQHHRFWTLAREGFERCVPGEDRGDAAPKQRRPGSASAWIDLVAPNETWRRHTGKRLHDLAEHEVERINTEHRQKAREQSCKPPPPLRCPSVRAFQTEVAARKKRS
jgi:hypothetical protein